MSQRLNPISSQKLPLNQRALVRYSKLFVLVMVCVLAVAACTNSRLVLRPLYNSLDDQLEKRLLGLVAFDDAQVAEVSELLDHFHVWHRQTQLPHYAALLSRVSESLDSGSPVTLELVEHWSRTVQGHSADMGQCSPMYSSGGLLASLSNEQVEAMEKRRAEQFEKWSLDEGDELEGGSAGADDAPLSNEARLERRAKRRTERLTRLRRYVEIAGLKVTESQFNDLKTTHASQRYPQTRFRTVLTEWDTRFFALLKERKNENWQEEFTQYVDSRRQAFRQRRVNERAYNTKLWEDYTVRTLNNLSEEQRVFLVGWLAKLSATVTSLAKDQPSYTAKKAIDHPCNGVRL